MLRLLSRRRSHHASALVAISCAVPCTYMMLSSSYLVSSDDTESHAPKNIKKLGIIETDLMDKIAKKAYLNYHLKGLNGHEKTAAVEKRPAGVPESLRVLTIDVPEFRQRFDEECLMDHSAIFPDGITPPRKVVVKIPRNNTNANDSPSSDQTLHKFTNKGPTNDIEVIQKSLIKSLSRCGKKSKTILLEASISNLNPRNLKRKYEFNVNSRLKQNDDDKNSMMDKKNGETNEASSANDTARSSEAQKNIEDEEKDFPWHQKAWIEEMDLRINGKVAFSSPLEPSSRISRLLFGNYYRSSVPQSTSFIRKYILFPFLDSSKESNGVDMPNANNRASNKPHAVIADGAAMYSVPGSLLHLSRCCKEANVPLFIINDPRTWGHNTHSDIALASRDLRKTVKTNVVQNALKIKEGSSFERGRSLGRMETQLSYKIRDATNKTKKAFLEAKKSLEGDDWSCLDEKSLKNELLKRRVISTERKNDESNDDEIYECSDNMMKICMKCVQNLNNGIHEESVVLEVISDQVSEDETN